LCNNIANCYYYAWRSSQNGGEAEYASFLSFKKRFMAGLETNHGSGTPQRELHYFLSLYRMLQAGFPSRQEELAWAERWVDLCTLHFGQPDLPKALEEAAKR